MFLRTLRFIFPLLLAFASTISTAQTDPRQEAAVGKLIEVQAEKAGAILDERALEALVGRFRRTNPSVSEDVWLSVKKEVKVMFLRILAEKEGPLSKAVREAMPRFTIAEIEKLVAIHTDPLFIKYTDATLAAMNTPAGELALRMAIERSVVEMNELVLKRGLKPAY